MAETINKLDVALLADGNRFVNFFEGRVLTGRDLRDQQAADYRARNMLGRAIGGGVVHGLTVSPAPSSGVTPRVTVAPGLALNREGEALGLAHPVTVELSRVPRGDGGDAGGELFAPCPEAEDEAPVSDELVTSTSGHGFYVLTVMPGSGYQEDAPKTGLGDGGVARGCGRRYVTRGVRFLLHRVDVAAFADLPTGLGAEIAALADTDDPAESSKLRNMAAHAMLGSAARRFAADAFATDLGEHGLFDHPIGAPAQITDCEVPLALLRWTNGLRFVDLWSVRRRTHVAPASPHWPLVASERRGAEAEARWFQFQEQLRALEAGGGLADMRATDHFRFLPAAGVLPLADATTFFGGLDVGGEEPLVIPGAQLTDMLETAMRYPSLDLEDASVSLRLFRPAENVGREELYVVYQSAEIPSLPWTVVEWQARQSTLERELDELEGRVGALQEALEASSRPGRIVGTVRGRLFATWGLSTVLEMSGVDVVVTRTRDGHATTLHTDTGGRFASGQLEPGTYEIRVDGSRRGYSVFEERRELAGGGTIRLEIELVPRGGGGRVGGILEDEDDVAGRLIQLIDEGGRVIAETHTDAAGNYVFDDVNAGAYRVRVEEGPDFGVGVNTGTHVNMNLFRRRGGGFP